VKKPVNGKTHVKKKVRSAITFQFVNDVLSCKCLDGKCPNYTSISCGPGGRAVFKQFGMKAKGKKIKKMIAEDKAFRMPYRKWG